MSKILKNEHKYIAYDGGPLLILPATVASKWNGINTNDYQRACDLVETSSTGIKLIPVEDEFGVLIKYWPLYAFPLHPKTNKIDVVALESWADDTDLLINSTIQYFHTNSSLDTGLIWKIKADEILILSASDIPNNSIYKILRYKVCKGNYNIYCGPYKNNNDNSMMIKFIKPS